MFYALRRWPRTVVAKAQPMAYARAAGGGACPGAGLCAALLGAQRALLEDRELDALALGQRDPRAGLLADLEHVVQAGGRRCP